MFGEAGTVVGPILALLNYAGIAVFALTGALTAAAKRQTFVTFVFFAMVTGTGGGTFRDLLIDAPVFWTRGNTELAVCLASALAVWFAPARIWPPRTLDWLDAAGLAAFSVYGAAKSLAFGIAPIPAVAMGVLTGCMGGIIRDVLAGEPSILLRPELYVTAAALGAALFVLMFWAGVPVALAGGIASVAAFALRGGAIIKGWGIPSYKG